MAAKKTISSWLNNQYLLILRNEDNFAEKTTFKFTYAKLMVYLLLVGLIFMSISLFLVTTLLSTWLDPRHSEMAMRKEVIELRGKVDSLKIANAQTDAYFARIEKVLKGDFDSSFYENAAKQVVHADDLNKEVDFSVLAPEDSLIRNEFAATAFTPAGAKFREQLRDLFFFSPLEKAVVTSPYNANLRHYGIDLAAKEKEPVKAVLDGTVIQADYNLNDGYIITIQHKNDLISVYKHNEALLKKPGDFVSTGDVIAIIGDSGHLSTGPHLHLELWFKGNPVDPEGFISF